ncbi:MAG: hypothetical protein JNM07_10170 [Phycisphaerae bacterium]|nr:hypothetical protein [Phycisphaerae bacterium]
MAASMTMVIGRIRAALEGRDGCFATELGYPHGFLILARPVGEPIMLDDPDPIAYKPSLAQEFRTMTSSRRSFALCLIRTAAPLAATVVVGLAGGCQSESERQLAEIRRNPTPELDTLSQRHDDIDNTLTVMADENFRMLNEDLGRFWLLDRPSRLSPTRMPR